jgi:putative nucleotidyltransferase with HDIG domain
MAEDLRNKIEKISSLPTLPGVVRLVCTMVEEEGSSANQIAEVISRDQVLSAKLLRMVNSPFYGFPGRISTVTHALVLLGFNVVKGLVISAAVFENMGNEMRGLWQHSLGTALLSRRLAMELRLPEPEQIMIAGLLHDLGKLVLNQTVAVHYQAALEHARVTQCHIGKAERDVFDTDHSEVGAWMAQRWHLPEPLCSVLRYHHEPDMAIEGRKMTAVVHVADVLARAMDYGDPLDTTMPPFDADVLRDLCLNDAQILRALDSAEQDFQAGAPMFGMEG